DRAFAAADTLATSYVLARAVQKNNAVDLVLCGRQAIEGNTAQVGPQLADKLGINQLTYVEKIEEIKNDTISVWRDVEDGSELVGSAMPVLLTVTDSANIPRPPSAKKTMQYKKALSPAELGDAPEREQLLNGRGLLIEQWDAAGLDVDPALCGLAGSPTRVKKIQSVVLKGKEFKRVEPTEAGITELLEELVADYTFD
ncbi:MAG: electron transfer flavoprotein beta subunit/FixA family protein, partial [Deltaproteobacteria bacterium]|nr:electron transfer flavoprotein beta subunit/FixA family protein [Deltaproteobacteria bacterium]